MPSWLLAAIAAGAALLAAGARLGAWWRGRAAARELARAEAHVDQVELERDGAAGAAAVATTQVEVLSDHAERQQAAAEVATEVRDAAAAAGPAPLDRVRAVDDWVRAHADRDGAGAVPDPRRPPPVPRK